MAIFDERWSPGIGDPTVMGWVTVFAYAVVALMCLLTSKAETDAWLDGTPSYARFWRILFIALILLGINKQLDLQSLFTQIGKDFAIRSGWYEDRRVVQQAFIAAMIIVALAAGSTTVWVMRRAPFSIWLAITGAAILGGFVIIRAASFHHMDQLISYAPAGIRMNWVFEIGALALLGYSAIRHRQRLVPGVQ